MAYPRILSIAVLFPLATGCVSRGTHEQLQRDHEQTQRELNEAKVQAVQLDLDKERANRELMTEQELRLACERKVVDEAAARAAETTAALEERARLEAALKESNDELAATVKAKAGLKDSVEQMRVALDELARRKAEAERRVTEYRSLLSRFQALIDAGKLNVKIVDGRMVVAFASDVLFGSGSASLSKEGRAAIAEVAAVLAAIPERRFQVEGHTDTVPIKTAQFPSNWELAAARALTVVKTMVDAG
ncbi:MAG: OmpA family protein, partial [Candidatus Limnocylindrus sp.]